MDLHKGDDTRTEKVVELRFSDGADASGMSVCCELDELVRESLKGKPTTESPGKRSTRGLVKYERV